MTRKSLKQMADEKGMTVEQLVVSTLETHGSVRSAAFALGISPSSIHWWLAYNGYRLIPSARVVKREEQQPS